MPSSSGFAISINAVDNASKTFEALNKRIGALRAPADRFNKSLQKFGDVTGINKMAEGVSTLGDRALGTARAIERMASPMAAITSAASIAGMIEFSRRWADVGNAAGKAAYQFNMPVDRLGALRGAARLAGSSAGAMDSSLQGLGQTLSAAHWGRDPAAISTLNALHIGFHGANGQARQASDALGDVADAISKYKDARTQTRILEQLGISPDMLPLLKNGRQGLEDFRKQAEQTGGVMTGEMVQNATKMNTAWQRLGLDIEGVGNRIADSWSGTIDKVLASSSRWIESNPKLVDSITQIGIALTALKSSAWILRLLGYGAAAGAMSTAGTLASPLALSGDTPSDPLLNQAPGSPGFFGQGGTAEQWLRARLGYRAAAAPGAISVPRAPSAAAGTMQRAHDFFRAKGLTENQTAGILSNISAESGFDPTKYGDNGTSYGLFQDHADRLDAMRKQYGTSAPSEQQQLEFAWSELNTSKKSVLGAMDPNDAARSGATFASGFEVPAGGDAEALRRGQAANQFVQGNVHVTVDLRGAPPGTTATATASGAATASPPRVETSMAHAR